jgi:Phage terminase large subunit (GpA).
MGTAEAPEDPQGYERIKARAAARSAELSRKGRELGELPAVVNPRRRKRAEKSFRFFAETYFPLSFPLKWSRDHLRVIERIEAAVLEGGLFALAMPRGSGKTTLCEAAAIWALLAGHRRFVCLIGSSEAHAVEMLDSIRVELEVSELLLEDWPEVCFPIARLEGIANRAAGQTHHGERTRISWTDRELVLPTIEGSKASGAVVRVAGITGRIRGMKAKRADGESIRPELVIVDDPQTDESARSLAQCEQRERILSGAVLGLAGPGRTIAGILPCTVIHPGDVADRLLDRSIHPEWNGERCRMLYALPNRLDLWDRYAEIQADGMRAGDNGAAATAYYKANRKAMDAGADPAWPARFNPGELSAIQHAMNRRIRDPLAFAAECQNEPIQATERGEEITAERILERVNGYHRGAIPIGASHVTAMIDVQQSALFWLVSAWSDDFTGAVVDYGVYPDQGPGYFTLRELKKPLEAIHSAAGLEGRLLAGLEALTAELAGREWVREDGARLRLDRGLIDANWHASTEVVYDVARRSPHGGVWVPSHGRYVGASSAPFRITSASRVIGWGSTGDSHRWPAGGRSVMWSTIRTTGNRSCRTAGDGSR